LLDELRAAQRTGQLDPACLFKLVTTDAARLLRLKEKGLGQIVEGGLADLVLLSPPTKTFSSLLNVNRAQIELVLVGGKPLLSSPELASMFAATGLDSATVQVDGVTKLLPQKLVSRLRNASVGEPGLTLGA
jgi:cytosine/adenosine deaminase-related metal-dependent hydrolase